MGATCGAGLLAVMFLFIKSMMRRVLDQTPLR
jgi:hypothetical protein